MSTRQIDYWVKRGIIRPSRSGTKGARFLHGFTVHQVMEAALIYAWRSAKDPVSIHVITRIWIPEYRRLLPVSPYRSYRNLVICRRHTRKTGGIFFAADPGPAFSRDDLADMFLVVCFRPIVEKLEALLGGPIPDADLTVPLPGTKWK
jgi:hypothetical protein